MNKQLKDDMNALQEQLQLQAVQFQVSSEQNNKQQMLERHLHAQIAALESELRCSPFSHFTFHIALSLFLMHSPILRILLIN